METASAWDWNLFTSSCDGDVEGVMAALAHGGRVTMRSHQGGSPFLAAAQRGHTVICGLLLTHGSNVNEMDSETWWRALHFAADNADTVDIIRAFVPVVSPENLILALTRSCPS